MTHVTRAIASALLLAVGFSSAAQAGVVILGTRAIFPGNANDITIRLSNKNDRPALVQTWIDNGQPGATPESLKVPFTIAPPFARIEAGKDQALRVMFTGDKSVLPKDRESVFWFNMLDVPPKVGKDKAGSNYLQLAFRTRIKLFYRPSGLPGTQDDAEKAITWSLRHVGDKYELHGENGSAYFVSYNRLDVVDGGKTYPVDLGDKGMIAPKGSTDFPVAVGSDRPSGAAKVKGYAVNDFGGFVSIEQPAAL